MFFDQEIIAFELVASNTYLSSGVNMLTNSIKISNTTETEFSKLIFFQVGQKREQKYCRSDLRNVSDPLTY